ncbi:VWA domain-containing protein [uncultured Sphingomonas sp.]|uniref:VWA domain-containing protein n=1 Tax=uncultured Sphingomonas sp. TaxID=158754 RepID=UPI0035CABCCC
MRRALDDLVRALRIAGLPISPADTIEASRAATIVPFADRALFRDALCATLAKSGEEAATFDRVFDAFFDPPPVGTPPLENRRADGNLPEAEGSALARMMLSGDEVGLSVALAQAAGRADVTGIRFATQRSQLSRQVLEEMGVREVDAVLAAARRRDPQSDSVAQLEQARAALAEQARALVARQYELYASQTGKELREAQLIRQALTADGGISPDDQAIMRHIVRRLAKQLASRYSRARRRALVGKIDVRRTLHRSMAHEGVPFELIWKTRKIAKPSIVCLCDVSKSVASAAAFLLTFLYSLSEVVDHLESYAFSGRLADVGALLDRLPIEAATAQVLSDIGFRQTDYGRSLQDFAEHHMASLNHRTTIIILGDARGNHADPRLDIFAEMAKRSRAVVWLNPEPRTFWGRGDSDMLRYERFCHIARTCNTLKDLERVIDDVLRSSLPH